jgi:hypothetical protein
VEVGLQAFDEGFVLSLALRVATKAFDCGRWRRRWSFWMFSKSWASSSFSGALRKASVP